MCTPSLSCCLPGHWMCWRCHHTCWAFSLQQSWLRGCSRALHVHFHWPVKVTIHHSTKETIWKNLSCNSESIYQISVILQYAKFIYLMRQIERYCWNTADEIHSFDYIHFHRDLSASAMSIDMNQYVSLSLSFILIILPFQVFLFYCKLITWNKRQKKKNPMAQCQVIIFAFFSKPSILLEYIQHITIYYYYYYYYKFRLRVLESRIWGILIITIMVIHMN